MKPTRYPTALIVTLVLLAGCGSQTDETPPDTQVEALDRARAVEDQLLERADRMAGQAAGDSDERDDDEQR